MVIIGGDAGGNEGDVFLFTFFSFVFDLFFNLCMYANVFFSCFLLVA